MATLACPSLSSILSKLGLRAAILQNRMERRRKGVSVDQLEELRDQMEEAGEVFVEAVNWTTVRIREDWRDIECTLARPLGEPLSDTDQRILDKLRGLDAAGETAELFRALTEEFGEVLGSVGLKVGGLDGPVSTGEPAGNGKTASPTKPRSRQKAAPAVAPRTEKVIREAIEKALADLQAGKPVDVRKGRITKIEVASRCSLSADYIKNSEEWRFYAENGHVRPQGEPTEGERDEAVKLLGLLLPKHPHLLNRMARMGEEDKLKYTQELTKALVPIAKRPADQRMELGLLKLEQFSDDKSETILPLVTHPGKNTPAVPRFETVPSDDWDD